MKEQIEKYINKYSNFSNAEFDQFYSKLELQQLEKKEFLVESGKICTYYYYVVEGLVRSYYLDIDGNEKISHFALSNWWITSLESFVAQTPSFYTIQTIEPTTILKIHRNDLENLYESIPKLERLFRLITQNTLIAIQRKTDIYKQMKSKERYNHFYSHFPDFFQRVPLYMIASYIGITPEYLSSLRKSSP